MLRHSITLRIDWRNADKNGGLKTFCAFLTFSTTLLIMWCVTWAITWANGNAGFLRREKFWVQISIKLLQFFLTANLSQYKRKNGKCTKCNWRGLDFKKFPNFNCYEWKKNTATGQSRTVFRAKTSLSAALCSEMTAEKRREFKLLAVVLK